MFQGTFINFDLSAKKQITLSGHRRVEARMLPVKQPDPSAGGRWLGELQALPDM